MSNTVKHAAGIALISALAFGGASQANAQLITHKDLSLALATQIAVAAVEACKANGYAVSAHVLGREGQVIVAMRNENAGLATFENSMKKAYTSRTFRRSSGEFAEGVKGNPNAGALWLSNIVAAQGALPIKVGEDVVGAIGISGAPGGEKDEACAKTAIDKFADQLK
jgi:uncharacterized protein GlcG (DUF336 family)